MKQTITLPLTLLFHINVVRANTTVMWYLFRTHMANILKKLCESEKLGSNLQNKKHKTINHCWSVVFDFTSNPPHPTFEVNSGLNHYTSALISR